LRIIVDGQEVDVPATHDASGDGRADTALVIDVDGVSYQLTDKDGDGRPDLIRAVSPDGSHRILVADQAGTFRPLADSTAPDDSIEEDASHWFAQATHNTCGPAAITMVLADMFDLRLCGCADCSTPSRTRRFGAKPDELKPLRSRPALF